MHVPSQEIRPRLERVAQDPSLTQVTQDTQVTQVAQAPVPTRYGTFQMVVFRAEDPSIDPELGLSQDHVALVMGDVRGKTAVLCRMHSECLTSEVFGSLKCDCKEQLELAQAEVARRGEGVVLYLRQEGRGIGLGNKLRAYALQAEGHDTVDANRLLGLPDDARDYTVAAQMLRALGVVSVELMTNNPLKLGALEALGVEVEQRVATHIRPNPFSAAYLETKRARMGHAAPPAGLGGPLSPPGAASSFGSSSARAEAACYAQAACDAE